MPEITQESLELARRLWEYHGLITELQPVDFVLALGSHDERVAHHAASLMLQAVAPVLVTSGGFGKVTSDLWKMSEGRRFAEIAIALGVPSSQILIEETADNTGDNIKMSRELLSKEGIKAESGVLVTKPYMRRRAFATASKQWPELKWLVDAPQLSFEEYPNTEVPQVRMIELMVGDLQRLHVYAEQGFQTPQDIPQNIWRDYERLVELGFDRYVLKS